MKKMELLSPAGDWDALVAAVENGADAVYLGGKTLNARRGAGNFDDEQLVRAADYLHERGKKMFVTVNTLLKQDEMPMLEEVAESLARAGADAAIVQDFGVSRALSKMLPSLHLHASTQMAIHNRQGVAFAKQMGFRRVVLARELSFKEIQACAQEGLEIEVFCHGALCVACSGQCLFSSMVGGRSGNRGVCAQPCRLPYRLEGAAKSEGCLLSPKDLMALDDLNTMGEAGVTSLKIEGRLKRPEYVAVVTGIYRRALDGEPVTDDDREALKQMFNRGGFTRGYAPGIADGEFLSRLRPSHWGRKVGQADSAREVRLFDGVQNADALVIRPERGEDVPLRLCGNAGDRLKNPTGVRGELIRLVSEDQMAAARDSFRETKRTVPVDAELIIHTGESARVMLSDGERTVYQEGWTPEPASRAAADAEKIRAQFSKTGGTPYYIRNLKLDVRNDPFVPASELNALRRNAFELLAQQRREEKRVCDRETRPFSDAPVPNPAQTRVPRLIAQASDVKSLLAAQKAGAEELALFPKDVRRSHLDAQAAGLENFFLYIPPVLPSETLNALNAWANENQTRISGVYLTNAGQLSMTWPGEKRFDGALNIANIPAVHFLGAEESLYTPSVELSTKEIERVGGRRELIVYGRIPLMHLRHCPLNAARGGGAHTACRRCDKAGNGERLNDCTLIDRMHIRFPLSRIAMEEGCIIDVMNSVPLSLVKHTARLPEAEAWRMLFFDENETEIQTLIRAFAEARDGIKPDESLTNGITTGHYFRPVE